MSEPERVEMRVLGRGLGGQILVGSLPVGILIFCGENSHGLHRQNQ
jgi:hypothetical protein